MKKMIVKAIDMLSVNGSSQEITEEDIAKVVGSKPDHFETGMHDNSVYAAYFNTSMKRSPKGIHADGEYGEIFIDKNAHVYVGIFNPEYDESDEYDEDEDLPEQQFNFFHGTYPGTTVHSLAELEEVWNSDDWHQGDLTL